MELIEDAPPVFFETFYVTVCEYMGVDPDALFLKLTEGNR